MSEDSGYSSPRQEAERLVATVLAAASVAARGAGGLATGGAECCVCPLCRAIAALRDPSPEFADRLATGAGDLATGIASVLRAFGGGVGDHDHDPDHGGRAPATAGDEPEPGAPDDDPWRAATRTPSGDGRSG